MSSLNEISLQNVLQIHCELARRKFDKFVPFLFKDYELTWFHLSVIKKLEMLYNGEITKLMIFIPPQHGKSLLSSILYPAWCLGKNPNLKIALCSYNATTAAGFNRKTQAIIDSAMYNNIFQNTTLNQSNVVTQSQKSLRNSEVFEINGYNGFYKSVGIGGAITGTAVDLLIIDDPFKGASEAHSITIRNRVWEWYNSDAKTRLHNNSKQLMLFTRWHEDDLAGRILNTNDNPYYNKQEADSWHVVKYEAIKENRYTDDDVRPLGEALYPQRHNLEKLLLQRELSPHTFNALYQQNPTPLQGGLFKKDWFSFVNFDSFQKLPKPKGGVVWDFFIDTANTKDTRNDATGIAAVTYIGNTMYIRKAVGVYVEAGELPFWIHDFVLANGYTEASSIFIERKSNGIATLDFISRLHELNRNGKSYQSLNVAGFEFPNGVGNKDRYARADGVVSFCVSKRVVFIDGEGASAAIEQICAFPNAAHDDVLDAAIIMPIHYYLFSKKQYAKEVAKYF